MRARSDAVIIDSNPCATFLTRLAITSADHIVAPVRPEKYSLTGLNMLEHVVREVRGRPLRPSEFSVLLNGVNDRPRPNEFDADAITRADYTDPCQARRHPDRRDSGDHITPMLIGRGQTQRKQHDERD